MQVNLRQHPSASVPLFSGRVHAFSQTSALPVPCSTRSFSSLSAQQISFTLHTDTASDLIYQRTAAAVLQQKPSYQRARCRVHKAFSGASHRARVGRGGGDRVGGGGGGGGEFRCVSAGDTHQQVSLHALVREFARIGTSLYMH